MTSVVHKQQGPGGRERSSRALEDPAEFLLDIGRAVLVLVTIAGVLVSVGREVWKYATQGVVAGELAFDVGVILLVALYVVWGIVRERKNA